MAPGDQDERPDEGRPIRKESPWQVAIFVVFGLAIWGAAYGGVLLFEDFKWFGRFAHISVLPIAVTMIFMALFVAIAVMALMPDKVLLRRRGYLFEGSTLTSTRTYLMVFMLGFGTLILAVGLMQLRANGWDFPGPQGAERAATAREVGLLPLWHILDVAPFVKVNSTMGWDEPAGFTHPFVGALLLVLKLGIVLVVVDGIRTAVRKLRE